VAKDAHFWAFTLSADAAAEPAASADFFTCDGASVSGTVASQRRQRSQVHGTNVAPSGLLASAHEGLEFPGLQRSRHFEWLIG